MIQDDADTDFVCRTNVSLFSLTFEKLKEIKNKRQDLSDAREKVKHELYAPSLPLALDYIFHNNTRDSYESYLENMRKNTLRVKFKNVIMQKWTQVKEEKSTGSIQDMVD